MALSKWQQSSEGLVLLLALVILVHDNRKMQSISVVLYFFPQKWQIKKKHFIFCFFSQPPSTVIGSQAILRRGKSTGPTQNAVGSWRLQSACYVMTISEIKCEQPGSLVSPSSYHISRIREMRWGTIAKAFIITSAASRESVLLRIDFDIFSLTD